METIAVDCSWADAQLEQDEVLALQLPPELRTQILQSSGSTYLNALSVTARKPGCTDLVFALYEPVFVEIAARWVSAAPSTLEDDIVTLSCLARLLPFATHLRPIAAQLITRINAHDLTPGAVWELHEDHLTTLLLSLFRLLSFDRVYFDRLVDSASLSRYFRHQSILLRFLGIVTFCQAMHLSDAYETKLTQIYVGKSLVLGKWEGRDIDYRLLQLWEERRWKELEKDLEVKRRARLERQVRVPKELSQSDLTSLVTLLGSTLLLKEGSFSTSQGSFVTTPNAKESMNELGNLLLHKKAIQVTGPPGSGKTSLILEAARVSGKLDSLLTLHLNEQTDAKSLLGLHTSSASGAGFTWRPGVLTKAIQEGRWVLIEDIDRASPEVLGVLRPIIENNALFIPSRKQTVRANDSFRLLATVRSSSAPGASITTSKNSWLSNKRLWNFVNVPSYDVSQMAALVSVSLPFLQPLIETIIRVHSEISALFLDDLRFRAAQNRSPSLRDLLKWCRRVNGRLQMHRVDPKVHAIPETCQADILKDALDCYASHLSDGSLYQTVAASVARAMNIAPQQLQYHLNASPSIVQNKQEVKIGRSSLSKLTSRQNRDPKSPFANTSSAERIVESISAGIAFSEPYLLVGETGVGKTSAIQYIASLVDQKLTVINLSQQSEGTDLLGGLKPVTIRSLILPLAEKFDDLFDETFPNGNEQYKTALSKTFAKQSWPRLLKMWKEASQLANQSLSRALKPGKHDAVGPAAKKRKVDRTRQAHLLKEWAKLSESVGHIQARVGSGETSQTFAFVEGRLVQAVRNGEWLLLDEINLATSDTLDHIASLLQEGLHKMPYIMLTEAGDVEKIEAHSDFRIFAAMNPATDAGKKELIPSIRSRFTELYVQAGDKDTHDLIQIIQAYLSKALANDKRAASDLAKAYLEVQKFSEDRRLTDGAGEPPHFSIRSLVRCLLYVAEFYVSHGLRRSMYEGFAMSFFTTLSQESEHLISPAVCAQLLSSVKNIKSFLSQQPKMTMGGDFIAFRHHLIPKGSLPLDLQPHYIRTPSVERNLESLARAASIRRFPILLQGPTSSGKTSMIEYLAKISGHKFVRINNHEHTDLQEYLGSYTSGADGKLLFRDGVLVNALREGHWLVLDELNLAPSDVLEALNRLLDDNRELLIPETQEVIRPHPKFMLFATQNPAGLYGGRKRLSRAFRNRFLEIHFDDIPEHELETILRERSQIPPSFCSQIVAVYKKLSFQRQSARLFEHRNSFATLRDLFRWAERRVDDRQQLGIQGFMLLGERVRDPAEREIVRTTLEETLKIKIDDKVIYSSNALPEVIKSYSNIVWTTAMRRLYILVSEAILSKEPVLLVGETGCGKTQICQVIAHAFGRPLNIYNAHTNTETGDLIGSQRPTRARSQLVKNVLDSLQAAGGSLMNGSDPNEASIDHLVSRFNDIDTSNIDPQALAQVRASIGAYRALFQWNDGSLVRSMKAGEHFLLDEISLADDSVLERLNSVLEPSRTILLAEKGSVENVVKAKPDFQFLATMNPGGDYGKRELSAALRNRMTEIWVPALSQEDDVLPILKAKLDEHHAHLAPLMLKFARWFGISFHAASADKIVLRDLLAWCGFVQSVSHLDPEVAFVHGASLVYIDSLGTSPAGMATSHVRNVSDARAECLRFLQSFISTNVSQVYNTVSALQINHESLIIGPFTLIRHSDQTQVSTDLVFEAPTTLKNTLRIVRGLQMDRPILLEGSPGVGKTAIVTALATMAGKPFTRINLSDQTDLMDLFGADVPTQNRSFGAFSWKDGPLLKAMQEGEWVLLDEMNLASQSVLEGLNSCLDHRKEAYVAELDKTFPCHPEFRLFAAQNPHHQGGGRKGLPASFVNRFTVVYADPFTEEDLLTICRIQNPETVYNRIQTIVHAVYAVDRITGHNATFGEGAPWEMNLRDVTRWLELANIHPEVDPLYHFPTVVNHRFRNARQRLFVANLLHAESPISGSQSLYNRLSPDTFRVGLATLHRAPIFQPATSNEGVPTHLLSHAQSIITAVSNSWPVILAGSSGSGKTQLLRSLAAVAGARLIEISMNSDTDAMDLLGGFEQYDEERELEELKKKILKWIDGHLDRVLSDPGDFDISWLLGLHCVCHNAETTLDDVRRTSEKVSAKLQEAKSFVGEADQIQQRRQTSAASFVWNEGILVEAVKNGEWVVLDHANLCNASVLDRLNSLLEPNGRLIISEHHDAVEGNQIVQRHPDFRIFLSMDPRYGELSRAMRNRSLEVFLDADENIWKPSKALKYPFASSIDNLRQIFDMKQLTSSARPAIDNLSLEELGTLQSQPGKAESVELQDRDAIDASTWASISQWLLRHATVASNATKSHGQNGGPQQPLLNEPLVLQTSGLQSQDSFGPLAIAWDIMLTLSKLRHDLSAAAYRAKAGTINTLTELEKSCLGDRDRKSGRLKDKPLWNFLMSMLEALFGFVNHCIASNLSPIHVENTLPLVRYLQDVVGFSTVTQLDPARFQALLTIGNELCRSLAIAGIPLAQNLGTALENFQTVRLKHGQSLQLMWQTWRPATASNLAELKTKLAFQQMAEQFDSLSFRLPQTRKQLLGLKIHILQAAASGWNQPKAASLAIEMQTSLEELSLKSERRKQISNYYQGVFDNILRRIITQVMFKDIAKIEPLMLFSKSTLLVYAFSSPNWTTDALQKLEGISGHLDLDNRSLTHEIVTNTLHVQDQAFRAIHRLQEEGSAIISVVCNYTSLITSDVQLGIQSCAQTLLTSVLACHKIITASDNPDNRSAISQLIRLETPNLPNGSQYLLPIIDNHLKPAAKLLDPYSNVADDGNNSGYATGLALIHISVAVLKLMVPDRPFDPALYPQVVRERYQIARLHLLSKVEAQRMFNRKLMGQDSSLLLRLYEAQLVSLGEEPSAPTVARPEVSELNKVQAEFQNVIRNIIEKIPGLEVAPDIPASDNSATEWSRLRISADQMVARLDKMNRAYDDIVVPARQLLKCLMLGIDLIKADTEPKMKEKDRAVPLKHTPLLGSSCDRVLDWNPKDQSSESSKIAWLQHHCLQRSVTFHMSQATHQGAHSEYLDILDSFYERWKTQLAKDQNEEEAKARYYTYRDGEQDEESENREIAQMFPDFNDTESAESSSPGETTDHQVLSIQIATLHERLFAQSVSRLEVEDHIVEVLISATVTANSMEEVLPGILLQLQKETKAINGEPNPQATNIYTDSNIEEARKLFGLVQTIQQRFYEISDRWPEHAVPLEVIEFVEELLDFKLNSPLAKMLTKTEKLLEIMAQWQSVASREWSVNALMEDLTGLIISWRRKELTSWSRLLDVEKEKSDDNAKAWYFVAYEAVIYNSRRVVEDGDDVALYCRSLATTLEEFLRSTALGQFTPRLRLLATLTKTLAEMASENERLNPILTCVHNIIFHFSRYENGVQKQLDAKRAALEKAITEQIKLASWKDTNVSALRDSAKRSHAKLFRIVKKYRTLLGQPATGLSAGNVAFHQQFSNPDIDVVSWSATRKGTEAAAQDCTVNFPDWQLRPARLRDPINATVTMRQVYRNHEQELDVGYELELFRTDLAASLTELRKETPSVLTEENTPTVKHLRERKRKLLADTIKMVAHMGARRNLATSELEKQSSTALVLADTPELLGTGEQSNATSEIFHELLDSMPQARAALVEHSPDLTDGEVRRGAGLLEGLLSIVMKQRRQLSGTLTQLHVFETHIKAIRSVCDLSKDLIISHPTEAQTSLEQRLPWFAVILDVSCSVLTFQADHVDFELSSLQEALQSTATWLRSEQTKYVELMSTQVLPDALSTKSSATWRERIWQRLQHFGNELREWCAKEPNVAYLLKQLISWTDKPQQPIDSREGESNIRAVEVDGILRRTTDSVFLALQGLSHMKIKAPTSFEDAGWLVHNDKHLQESMKTLQIATISNRLGEVMMRLGHLKSEELPLTTSLLKVAAPILEQFLSICQHLQQKQAAIHLETCRLACFLTKSFATVATEGYCSPAEPNDGKEQSGKLESGTGLGEGEGTEDISKDVGADEDMSEFAQGGDKKEEEGEMSEVEDAVDMGADELDGEMGNEGQSKERGEDGESGEEESGDEIDEEEGSVDDLDPTAVDEKMWDDAAKEAEEQEKELKSQKEKGKKGEDQTERQQGEAEGENEGEIEEGDANDEEIEDDDKGAGKAEAENADPHLQEEEALDLPEEMQLNGEEETAEDEISNDGMDELSDIEQPEGKADEVENVSEPDEEQQAPFDGSEPEAKQDNEDDNAEGSAEEDKIMEEEPAQEHDEVAQAEREGELGQEQDEQAAGETGRADQLQDNIDPNLNDQGQNEMQQANDDQKPQGGKAANEQEQSQSGKGSVERGTGRDDQGQRPQDEALRRLADILEQWHRRREIFNPGEDRPSENLNEDVNMGEADFEHIEDEGEADTQALGAAEAHQAQNLDPSKAIQDEEMPSEDDVAMPDVQKQEEEDATIDRLNRLQSSSLADRQDDGSYVPDQRIQQNSHATDLNHPIDADMDDTTASVRDIDLAAAQPPSPPTSSASASELWSYCSSQVHAFSLVLTEQLRLILSPTTATKLRGDFRTGKRLNIKRIIPYIASGYKRDKIWMRRSVPSKRNYQVLLAVDDSKSMSESGADLLALQTTALLAKSLSMLEVGDIAVIGFGDEPNVTVAHGFGKPWTYDSGVEVFRQFGFQQRGTDVKNMVKQSLEMLREARLKSNVSNAADLWQLQLIISDGHCSDHEGIRRLVRQAKEERVVMVFVIVDNAAPREEGNVAESILDLKEAMFEPDTREGKEGEMRVVTRRYLERFPFEYYLVVRDVRDLPGVLSRCLKGWMGSVVET